MISDSLGRVLFSNIPEGNYAIKLSYAGMEEMEISISVPQQSEAILYLGEAKEHEKEVIVTATRISRTISDIPTRVETISGEALTEKGNMKPGDIRMLLNESTGIQTQQTSATSYNSSIRIQALDGRYTQVLRDGFPLYEGLQQSAFSEVIYSIRTEKTDWVIGANLITDKFTEHKQSINVLRNYSYNTAGVFVQHSCIPSSFFSISCEP